ncbi:MAG: hypothetical protein M3N41_06235 [Acidobacteriota bacterium]|nr:hypothetical protein [Acidobacteriota bacterium]
MRNLAVFLFLTSAAFSQNLADFGAVTAGSTVGGASGKAVSNGIDAIFKKANQQTAKAAVTPSKNEVPEPAPLKVSRALPSDDTGGVPLPPSPHKRPAASTVASYVLPQEITRIGSLSDVAPNLPPPPEMSPEKFRNISTGTPRGDVLRLGAPSSRITMFDEGHLVELYSYRQNGQRFGTLRLTDGAVSSVE